MTDNYSRPKRTPFPRGLAEMIARKASILASKMEDEAIAQMVRDAQRALDRGMSQAEIARQLGLR